jgi:ribosome-associated protein
MKRTVNTQKALAVAAARAADDKKALDVVVLDLDESSDIAEFVVIAGVESSAQLAAVEAEVEEALLEKGHRILRRDGRPRGRWIALDFGVVWVHILMTEAREFYRLDQLWEDAKRIPWEKRS